MALDLATLGVVVKTQGVKEAGEQLEQLTAAGKKTEQGVASLAKATENASKRTTTALGAEARAMQESTSRRERLARFIQTERGQRVLEAESVRATGVAMASTALSAKALQQATRQLPMQFTDIATSLAAGQRPLQVLLQQGGQLKDVFGGVGPALRGMAGYLRGLVNPATLVAGAVIGLAVAWRQAATQLEDMDRALIFSGQTARTTAEDLRGLAAELDRTTAATGNKAAAVVTQVTATGRFTEEQIRKVAQAAIELDSVGQQAIEDTIAQFVRLADSPVDAILKLNDAQNFLTRETLALIQELQEQGRTAEAVELAIQTLADTQVARAKDMRASLGFVSGAWIEVKESVGETWDAVTGFFRTMDEGTARNIASLNDYLPALGKIAEKMRFLGMGGFFANAIINSTPEDAGGPAAPVGDGITTAQVKEQQEAEAELARLRDGWAQNGLRYASERERMETEILGVLADGKKLGLEREQIESRVAAIREQYAEREARRKPRGKSEAEREALRLAREAAREAERILQDGQRASEDLSRTIEQNAADLAGPAAQAARAYADELVRLVGEEEKLRAAKLLSADAEAALALAREQAAQSYERKLEAIAEQKTAAEQLIEDLEFELRLMGLSNDAREREIALRYAGKDATAAQRAEIEALIDAQQREREVAEGMDTLRDSTRGFLRDLMEGSKSAKEAFRDFVDSVLAGIAEIVARNLTENLLGGFGTTGGGKSGSFFSDLFSSFFGGGREHGGAVSPGKIYEVGEGGKPELLQMQGKQYLLPGNDGYVTPMRDGGSGDMVVHQTIQVTGVIDPRSAYQLQRNASLSLQKATSR